MESQSPARDQKAAAAADGKVPELLALYDEVAKCGRCGFCQPTCPVYTATKKEAHVARGKNALFRNVIEGQTVLDPDLRDAFENCLLCRACTANCFPAVETDHLVVAFREAYAGRFGRPAVQRLIFRGLLPYPQVMAPLIRTAWTAHRLGLAGVAQRLGLIRMINPKLENAMQLRDEVPASFLRTRLKSRAPRVQATSGLKVGYRISCGYNYMLPEVGEATVDVLEQNGMAVSVLPNNCAVCPCTATATSKGLGFWRGPTSRSSATSAGTTTSCRIAGVVPVTSRSTRSC